jgi:hypothetical protein
MMGVPLYAGERVEHWENSALDSRIYLVEPENSTMSQNVPREQSFNAIDSEGRASADGGNQTI